LDSLQRKWLPVHTLAASGEFYLMDALLKHNVDINAVDVVGGMTMCWIIGFCQSHQVLYTSLPIFHIGCKNAWNCSILNFGSLYFLQNGWTALHRAIICKKQAIISYLLRESADPFVRDAVSIDAMTFFILYLFFCQYNHYIYLSYFTMFNLFSYD
jgi:transformer-2 protein